MIGEQVRWYDDTGRIVEFVPLAKPVKYKDENGEEHERSVTTPTLLHARKMGFLPSTTSVLKQLHSHSLTEFQIEHAIKQTILYPWDGEDSGDQAAIDRYVRMIRARAAEYGNEAADQGKVFHGAIEDFLTLDKKPEDPILMTACEGVRSELNKVGVSNVACETPLFSRELGYAGTPDIHGPDGDGNPTVWDVKTVEMKKFRAPYVKWKFQLGSYENLLHGRGHARLFQLVVCRLTGEVKAYEHDYGKWGDAFGHLFEVWVAENNYDPRKW